MAWGDLGLPELDLKRAASALDQLPEETRANIKRYGPLAIWIAVIFFMSSGEASAAQTSRLIRPILEFLFPAAPEETLLLYHGLIRKLAHFFEYAVLALLAVRAFSTAAQKRGHLSAIVLVLVVAVLDELNQSLNPTRTGSAWDVLIDTAGGISAIFAAWAVKKRRTSKSSS